MWDRRRRVIPPEESAKSLLLSGWLACPLSLQREEIEHSFMRLGIAENEKSYATFVGHSRQEVAQQLKQNVPDDLIPDMHPHWLDERNKGRLHIRLLCLRIVEDAVASVKYPALSFIAMSMALVHCMIPQVCGQRGSNAARAGVMQRGDCAGLSDSRVFLSSVRLCRFSACGKAIRSTGVVGTRRL